jgi:hypothetical protein
MQKLPNGKNNPMLPSDVPLCSARCRTRGGEPCRNAAMPNGRCRMHGGKSPAGIASPAWKSGRFSRYMPKRLQGYEEEYFGQGRAACSTSGALRRQQGRAGLDGGSHGPFVALAPTP